MITATATQNFNLEPVTAEFVLPFDASSYKKVSAVRTDSGHLLMYVCGGYTTFEGKQPREVHVFYANGGMWSSYGTNVEKAIQGAFADIWKQCL